MNSRAIAWVCASWLVAPVAWAQTPSTPRAVPGLTDVAAIVARGARTCARMNDGTARCWGVLALRDWNHAARRDGVVLRRAEPHRVQGLRDVAELAAGDQHTCARTNDGTVRCWGERARSQLAEPTDALAQWTDVHGLSGTTALAAGGAHTCAVALDATVRCWGENLHGELGDGTTEARPDPVIVQGIRGAVAVAAGSAHTCAALQDGTVRCWGDFLGDGVSHRVPVPVRGLVGVTALRARGGLTCALKSDGALGCWGVDRMSSRDGSPAVLAAPVWMADRVRTFALGERQLCTVSLAGAVQCRGAAAPALRGVVELSFGGSHACAWTSHGRLSCWGDNEYGQVGAAIGAGRATVAAPSVVSLGGRVAQVVAGRHHTCARTAEGNVWCWGRDDDAQLGNGPVRVSVPTVIPGFTGVTALSLGVHDLFGVAADHTARVWQGALPRLRLVREPAADFSRAVAIDGLARVVSLTSRELVTYAVRDDGTIYSWGYAPMTKGGLRRLPPFELRVPGVAGVRGIAAGAGHLCAWSNDAVWCWGENSRGQLGDGSRAGRLAPTRVRDITGVTAMALSAGASCALLRDGTVRCWGDNRAWLLGGARGRDSLAVPAVVEGVDHATQVAMGERHACALRDGGSVWCWGDNARGQLGPRAGEGLQTPAPVEGVTDAIAVAAGDAHTCALRRDHTVTCWGDF